MGYQLQVQPGTFLTNEAVILSGQTLSGVIDTKGLILSGIHIPSAFTGTEISFVACETDTGNFHPLYDSTSTAVKLTVSANKVFSLSQNDFRGFRYFKFKSNASEAADRTIAFSLRG